MRRTQESARINACFPTNLRYPVRPVRERGRIDTSSFEVRELKNMPTANDLRRGMAINYNGDISVVLDSQHRTPGNLRAFVQATLRSIRTGKSSDVRFSSTERIDVVPMVTTRMEFSYKDGGDYVFSDPENYETV